MAGFGDSTILGEDGQYPRTDGGNHAAQSFADVFSGMEYTRGFSVEDEKLDSYLALSQLFNKPILGLISVPEGGEASFEVVRACYEAALPELRKMEEALKELQENRDAFIFVDGVEDLCEAGFAKIQKIHGACGSEASFDAFLAGKVTTSGEDVAPATETVAPGEESSPINTKLVDDFAELEESIMGVDYFEMLGISAFDAHRYSYEQVKEFYNNQIEDYKSIEEKITEFRASAELESQLPDLHARCEALSQKMSEFHAIVGNEEAYQKLVEEASLKQAKPPEIEATGDGNLTEYGKQLLNILSAPGFSIRHRLGALGEWAKRLNANVIKVGPDDRDVVSELGFALSNLTENGARVDNLEAFERHLTAVQSGIEPGLSKSVDELICGADEDKRQLKAPPRASVIGKTPADAHLEPYSNIMQSLQKVLSNIALAVENQEQRSRVDDIKQRLDEAMVSIQEEYANRRTHYATRGETKQSGGQTDKKDSKAKGWNGLPFPVRAAIIALPAAFVGGLVAQGPGYLGVMVLTVYLLGRAEKNRLKKERQQKEDMDQSQAVPRQTISADPSPKVVPTGTVIQVNGSGNGGASVGSSQQTTTGEPTE